MPLIIASIRPLSWQDKSEQGYTLHFAKTPLGHFVYGIDKAGQAYFQSPTITEDVLNLETAKAAAEAVHGELVAALIEQHCDLLPSNSVLDDSYSRGNESAPNASSQ